MNSEEKILSMLEGLSEDVKGLSEEVKAIKQSQAVVERDVKNVKVDQARISLAQSDLSREQAELLSEVRKTHRELTEDIEIVRQLAVKNEYELNDISIILKEGYFDNQKLAQNYEPRIEKLEDSVDVLSVEVGFLKK